MSKTLIILVMISVVPAIIINIRGMSGVCNDPINDPDSLDAITARYIVANFANSSNRRVVWEDLWGAAGWDTGRTVRYLEFVRNNYTTITKALYRFLIAYNQFPHGRIENVNTVWNHFRGLHGDTSDSCATMHVWYRAWFQMRVGQDEQPPRVHVSAVGDKMRIVIDEWISRLVIADIRMSGTRVVVDTGLFDIDLLEDFFA
jgi:hypothetical protein